MQTPRAVLSILAAALLTLSSCAQAGDSEAEAATPAPAETTASTTTTSTTITAETTTTTLATSDSAQAEDNNNNQDQNEAIVTDESDPACVRLTDFSTDADNQRWLVVNDDVMGGQSLGGMSFEDNTMTFAGEVNTDGGGFASLRLPLQAGSLADFTKVAIRARPDERTYVITFDDNLPARNRRVSHRAPIPFDAPGEWQTITIPFEDLFPAIFGQPIDDLPFRPDLAVRMGLMISDGLDGPFQLDVDWIDLCP